MADEGAGRTESIGETARAYGRGALGAMLVSMPMLATMEMWWHGFLMPPWIMILFLSANFGVLIVLEYYSGFHETGSLGAEIRDALSAYGIGLIVAAAVLGMFSVLRPGMGAHELIGKIVLQSAPLGIGASIAISQLGGRTDEGEEGEARKERAGLAGSLTLSLAGAWYFGFNIAPTEEPLMIGAGLEWWHAVLLILGALAISHAIVYSLGFMGGHALPEEGPWWRAVLSYGVGSTIIALAAGAFFLFAFGRIGPDTALLPALKMISVMGFVNAFGAAAAKLIL